MWIGQNAPRIVELRANRRMKTGMVPLAGNESFSHSKTEPSIYCIFYCSYVGWTRFWPSSKDKKKSHMQCCRIFIRKMNFWNVYPKRLGRKFWNFVCFCYSTKHAAVTAQGLRLFCLTSERFHVDPANQVHFIRKTIFFRSKCNISGTNLSSPKTKNCECYLFGEVSEKRDFTIFGRAFWECR